VSLLHDAAARQLGRSEFRRPLVLEAGAGTGKTAVLVARIVHWALGPGWQSAAMRLQSPTEFSASSDELGAEVSIERIAEKVSAGIVAITFTDAAAVEMQMRVATALRGVHRAQEPDWLASQELGLPHAELARRAAALASCADRMRIQTIHGFCSSLLREYALEAGLHPRFRIDSDGRAMRGLAMDLVGRSFEELYGDQADPDALLLAAHGHGPSAVARDLHRLAAQALRPDELPEDPLDQERFSAWFNPVVASVTKLREALQSGASEIHDAGKVEARNTKGFMSVADGVAKLEYALSRLEGVEGLAELFAEDGAATLLMTKKASDWSAGKFSKTDRVHLHGDDDLIASELAAVLPALKALRGFQPEVLRAACRLMRRLLADAREEMRRQGLQCFDGLLRDARRLLREQPAIAARVREGIDQLMVDEFQDTDAGQCELVARLALDELPTEHRPGLFLVGDPKQSIYGWRNADLGAYANFVQRAISAGGELAVLDVNFRSVPPILDEVERCIDPIMEAEEGRQPAFQRLLPAPAVTGDLGFVEQDRAAVEHWVSWAHEGDKGKIGSGTRADEAREIEATAIAADLAELRSKGSLNLAGTALLLRSTTGLDVYLRAFREAGIPYQVERDRNYYRRREVVDAAALVRAIVDPHDQLALVATLRAPFIGVPDAAWLPLWKARFPELCSRLRSPAQQEVLIELQAAVQSVATEISGSSAVGLEHIPDWHESLLAAIQALAILRQSFRVDAADEFVAKLRAAFQQEGTEAARFLGAHRLANLERFYRRLSAALANEEGGPQAVLRALRVAVAEEEDESDSPPGDDSLDAVRVMTVHKSKGLTFQHVYLADVHGGGSGARGLPNCATAERKGRLEFCLFGVPTLGWFEVARDQERVSTAETVRLLYVALTRPQKRLVVCGKRNLPDGAAAATGNTLESLLRQRLRNGAELSGAFGDQRGQAIALRDTFNVLWRIPFVESSEQRVVRPQESTKLELEPLLNELKLLRGARAEARHKRGQSRLRTASRANDGHEWARVSEAGGGGEEDGWSPRASTDPELARAVGTAVHRALELLDLEAEPVSALRAQIDGLADAVRGFVPKARLLEVVRTARELLEEADRRGILYELFDRREQILGREVPVLLPDEESGGAIVGTLDLLYRDPNTGQLVVADFKTDALQSQEQFEQQREHYLAQGRVYQDAVALMFPEEEAPAFELWFLSANRIVRG
jgi:ATP-dependent exoDNAse (exonuclease V) beta subunit